MILESIDRVNGLFPSHTVAGLHKKTTCEVNGLRAVISIDRDFDKFKEVSRVLPEELVSR